MSINPIYMAMADAELAVSEFERSAGLNDPRVASLRAFKAYHKQARVFGMIDGYGRNRWMTKIGARILSYCQREAAQDEPQRLRMADIAAEVGCCVSTVSRTLLKLTAWGMFVIETKRGRLGGTTIRNVWASDWVTVLVDKARERLYRLTQKAWRRSAGYFASTTTYKEVSSRKEVSTRDAKYRDAVYLERARLALTDPEGESEAVHPLYFTPEDRAKAEAVFWFRANG